MRFWEAMKALEEGKKVRLSTWKRAYLYVTENGAIFINHQENQQNDFEPWQLYKEDFSDIWELYEEPPKTYKLWELIPALKEGKRIKRANSDWPSECYLYEIEEQEIENIDELRIRDLEADDWVICE